MTELDVLVEISAKLDDLQAGVDFLVQEISRAVFSGFVLGFVASLIAGWCVWNVFITAKNERGL